MWVLVSVLVLVAELTLIIVLGRRATAAYEAPPLVAWTSSRAPTEPPAVADTAGEPDPAREPDPA